MYAPQNTDMKEFEVEVCRIGYAVRTIKVKAENEEEAKEKATDEAGNHEFSEHISEYTTNWVSEVI